MEKNKSKIIITSPVSNNPRGKLVSSGQRKIIINLYQSLMQKYPATTYKNMLKELSKESGIGQVTIAKTISEYKRTGTVSSPNRKKVRLTVKDKTSKEEETLIRRKIHDFWFRNEIPNLKKVLNVVNRDPTLPDFSKTSLYRLLKGFNFTFTARSRNSALMEDAQVIKWRRSYLEKIKQYRKEGRRIYYIGDSMFSNSSRNLKSLKGVTLGLSISAGLDEDVKDMSMFVSKQPEKGRIIVSHIGSSDGFVDEGLLIFETKGETSNYRDEISGDVFLKWFRKILSKLEDNCVIVMDNAPYYLERREEFPSTEWKKADIIDWLVKKEAVVSSRAVKMDLMKLVQKYKLSKPKYVVDEYARQLNKCVLHTPPFHSELNAMELAWSIVKEYVDTNNRTLTMQGLKFLLFEGIEKVSVETWKNLIRYTEDEEKRLDQLNHIIDDLTDTSNFPYPCTSDDESELD